MKLKRERGLLLSSQHAQGTGGLWRASCVGSGEQSLVTSAAGGGCPAAQRGHENKF